MNISTYTVVLYDGESPCASEGFSNREKAVEYFGERTGCYGRGILLEHQTITNGDDIEFKTNIMVNT